MSEVHKKYSRRNFIKKTAGTGAGLALSSIIDPESIFGRKLRNVKSRVVRVSDHDILQNSSINPEAAQRMMDSGIMTLTGIDEVGDAWKSLFPGLTAAKIISIKVNCIESNLSSHPEVSYAIVNGLARMNVDGSSYPEDNVVIWDRTGRELREAAIQPAVISRGRNATEQQKVIWGIRVSLT